MNKFNKFNEIFNKLLFEEAKKDSEVKISKIKSIIKEILTPNFNTVKSRPYGFEVTKLTIKNGDKKREKVFNVQCYIDEYQNKSKTNNITIKIFEKEKSTVKKQIDISVEDFDEETFKTKMEKFLDF